MKILPSPLPPAALHPQGTPRSTPLQPIAAVDAVAREYPHSRQGADRLAQALLAQRSGAARSPAAVEPLHVRKALNAYHDSGRQGQRDYLSTLLGIDEFA